MHLQLVTIEAADGSCDPALSEREIWWGKPELSNTGMAAEGEVSAGYYFFYLVQWGW